MSKFAAGILSGLRNAYDEVPRCRLDLNKVGLSGGVKQLPIRSHCSLVGNDRISLRFPCIPRVNGGRGDGGAPPVFFRYFRIEFLPHHVPNSRQPVAL